MKTILLFALAFGATVTPPFAVARGTPAAEVSTEQPLALDLLGRWRRGAVYSSAVSDDRAVSDDYVFFESGGAIRVLETNDDVSTRREIASITTSGMVRKLFASANHLYVAAYDADLMISALKSKGAELSERHQDSGIRLQQHWFNI